MAGVERVRALLSETPLCDRDIRTCGRGDHQAFAVAPLSDQHGLADWRIARALWPQSSMWPIVVQTHICEHWRTPEYVSDVQRAIEDARTRPWPDAIPTRSSVRRTGPGGSPVTPTARDITTGTHRTQRSCWPRCLSLTDWRSNGACSNGRRPGGPPLSQAPRRDRLHRLRIRPQSGAAAGPNHHAVDVADVHRHLHGRLLLRVTGPHRR